MRREALCRIPGAAGRNSKEVLGSNGFTRIRKVSGTIACQESDGHAQVPGVRRRGTRVIWRKLDCLKPNLQKMKRRIRRKGTCYRRHALRWHSCKAVANLRGVERCPARAMKEMSRTPKSRSDVRQGRTRDQPSGREPQGDGVPIVVVGVATHQGGRESRPQGDMSRATYRPLCCAKKYVALPRGACESVEIGLVGATYFLRRARGSRGTRVAGRARGSALVWRWWVWCGRARVA